ncbi:MAG: hypothetical protein WDM88_01120 [Galbitalea sp.]
MAVLESTVVDRKSLLIELRAQPDGVDRGSLSASMSTCPRADGCSCSPPHYLTLKTTVDDLSWDDGRSLILKFRVPPREA